MTAGPGRSGKGRQKRPRLTEEDRSLWQRISASVEPLRQAKPRVPDVEAPDDRELGEAHQRPLQPPHSTSRKPAPKPSAATSPAAPSSLPKPARPSAKAIQPQPTVERRHARRIASGSIEIEARLDLHGLTQSLAHARLISFLQSAARSGLKTVLVITGKGAPRERASAIPSRHDREEVGVLRRNLPRWLAEAPLRGLVISYQSASVRHGGDGAFYILLRRSRGRPASDD